MNSYRAVIEGHYENSLVLFYKYIATTFKKFIKNHNFIELHVSLRISQPKLSQNGQKRCHYRMYRIPVL